MAFTSSDTVNMIDRCYPLDADDVELNESYQQMKNFFTMSVSDILQAWWILLVAIAISIIFSIAFFYCFKAAAHCIIWFIIVVAILALLVTGGLLLFCGIYHRAKVSTLQEKYSCYVFIGYGGVLVLTSLIVFLILITLRENISKSEPLHHEATIVLDSSCSTLFVSILTVAVFIAAFFLLCSSMVFHFSAVTHETTATGHFIHTVFYRRILIAPMLLLFNWISFFLLGIVQSVTAGVTVNWFFAERDAFGRKTLPLFPVLRSAAVVFTHHLGSVAIGSALISITSILCPIVGFIHSRTRRGGCLNGCISPFYRFLQYMSAQGYTMMMIQGGSFLSASKQASLLFSRHSTQTARTDGISHLIRFCGAATTTCISVIVSTILLRSDFLFLDYQLTNKPVYYFFFIVLLCGVAAFAIPFCFLSVCSTAMDALVLSFFLDEEVARQDTTGLYWPHPSPNLKAFFDLPTDSSPESTKTIRLIPIDTDSSL